MTGDFARGVFLVAHQELRIRLRTGRWRGLLSGWFVVVGIFTALLDYSARVTKQNGMPLFGGLMLFVLALALVVSPALTAQSVNGDRERGTLATLQVTALTPEQIAVGKLLAGWTVGLMALTLTVPFVGWSIIRGGVGPVRAVIVVVVTVLLIGVVCAVSQALSSLVNRSITSALLSYLTVFGLTVGTPVAFLLALPLTEHTVVDYSTDGTMLEQARNATQPELVWWLLAPNPFVVLADASPQLEQRANTGSGDPADSGTARPNTGTANTGAANTAEDIFDPLGELGRSVRTLRGGDEYYHYHWQDRWLSRYAVWPYGLGFNLILGAGALAITTRRLRAPARRLPRGVRVA